MKNNSETKMGKKISPVKGITKNLVTLAKSNRSINMRVAIFCHYFLKKQLYFFI